ncbi:aspartic peptidase domain-containing protein [Ilyonectria destructans]|nr:aspartic peptidase domain-containing protein [Ilyonectria destructans]
MDFDPGSSDLWVYSPKAAAAGSGGKYASSEYGTKLFTADLQHNAPGTHNFGFINKSALTGDITYTEVDSSGLWTFTSTGFAVGSSAISRTPIRGVADTGTSLLYLPGQVNEAYYSKVQGAQLDKAAGGFIFPRYNSRVHAQWGTHASQAATEASLLLIVVQIQTLANSEASSEARASTNVPLATFAAPL